MSESDTPEVIYLQAGYSDDESLLGRRLRYFGQKRIFRDDVEYIRADVVAAWQEVIESERANVNAAQDPTTRAIEDVIDMQPMDGSPRRVLYECQKSAGNPLYIEDKK